MTRSAKAIVVEGLCKRFVAKNSGPPAVDHISFTVDYGECVGLLGGNGAGKTTTLAMLMGVTSPTSGRIDLLGRPQPEQRLEAMARTGFTSPYTDLPHMLTVQQNMLVFANLYGVAQPQKRVAEVLEMFHLTPFLQRRAGKLSAGQRTRLGLAKAFLNAPELLLLDEPSASLDPDTADKLRTDIETYRKQNGATILMASHNMAEVERLCDRVIMMKQGRIVDNATPAELSRKYGRTDLEQVFLAIARDELGEVAE
jgi:ABC-2 type transport system ATP-binding protein